MLPKKPQAHRFGLLAGFLFIVIGLCTAPASSVTLEPEPTFSLNVVAERISLEAEAAPLERILARLSAAIDVPIRALGDHSEPITITFRDLPLKEALARLSNRVVYLHDPKTGAINRIIVLPEGDEGSLAVGEAASATRQQPFKFEFDPSEGMEQ